MKLTLTLEGSNEMPMKGRDYLDKTLGYLREILSNYTEEYPALDELNQKIENHDYQSEEAFVRGLNETQMSFLENILKEEIKHANEVQDEKRSHELNEVYELLY